MIRVGSGHKLANVSDLTLEPVQETHAVAGSGSGKIRRIGAGKRSEIKLDNVKSQDHLPGAPAGGASKNFGIGRRDVIREEKIQAAGPTLSNVQSQRVITTTTTRVVQGKTGAAKRSDAWGTEKKASEG